MRKTYFDLRRISCIYLQENKGVENLFSVSLFGGKKFHMIYSSMFYGDSVSCDRLIVKKVYSCLFRKKIPYAILEYVF
jgi:hypothetical protein